MIDLVENLPAPIRKRIGQHHLIVFDGECVLCSGFFHFMLRHDHGQKFQFATAQSRLGQDLYTALKLPTEAFETNLVISDGIIHGHLDAFAIAMSQLGWPWRIFLIVRYLPRFLKMPLYTVIARNRYRLFGRFDRCMIPDPDLRARFVEDGF
ncbi:MAG: DCC1-like thiol-disulfide oxidoreductase family protein [Sulfitobacter sp.]